MNVKNKTILVVGTVILALSGFFLYQGISSYDLYINEQISSITKDFDKVIVNIKNNLLGPYKVRIKGILATHPQIAESLANHDRELLYNLCLPKYEFLKRENRHFNIMQFYLPDGTLFLRIGPHKLSVHNATSHTNTQDFNKPQKASSGFQFDKEGDLYRVAQPIYFKDKYVGAIEFGIHSKQILEFLRETLKADVTCYFNKDSRLDNFLEKKDHVQYGQYFVITHENESFAKLRFG